MEGLRDIVQFFRSQFGEKFNGNISPEIVTLLQNLNRQERGELKDLLFNEARKLELDEEKHDVIFWLQNCFETVERHSFRLHKVYFSPGEDILRNIEDLITESKKQIDLCVFTITDFRLARKLVDANRRGVKIRIITDDRKTFDDGSEIYQLDRSGIKIKIDHSRYHMHNKFGIIDQRIAFTGSFNWTYTATKHNNENLLITTNYDIVNQYKEEFEKLWLLMFDL